MSLRCLAALMMPLCCCTALRAADKPNLVVMMTDDQRFDAMSCAGNKILQTPNMDRIAKEGMRFRNMFVINSLCAPSRATLMSGLYSHSHGVIDNKVNDHKIPAELKLLPDYLKDAGYEVAFCGKSHVAGALRERPWTYYFGYKGQGDYLKPVIAEGVDGVVGKDQPYDGYMDDVVTEHALKWLKKKHDKPICLFLFFKAPHRSWDRAPRHKDLFKDVEIPKPDTYDLRAKDSPGKPKAFHDADNKIGSFKDVPSLDEFAKNYYATLVAVDENVGKVFEALTDTKMLDNTAIMFTSDNGFFMGEWQAFDKRFMHEPSIRVPMLIRYPKLAKGGSVCDRMVLNVDIAPTLLDLAGVKVPKEMHGRSMVPLLKGDEKDWRKDWLYEYFEYPGPHSVKKHRGVRTEQYKYIHYYEEPQEYELYDLEKDPQEKENLYGKKGYEDVTKQLQTRLEELRKETGDR
jgi:arylsulfatase A-like enzyme